MAKEEISDFLHKMPADLKEALSANSSAKTAWADVTALGKNEWICWVMSAKKEETRKARITRAIKEVAEGKKRPCCWPGCPHRRPSAQKWFK